MKDLKEQFMKEHAEHTESFLLRNEVYGVHTAISFEEESEWVADWWIQKFEEKLSANK